MTNTTIPITTSATHTRTHRAVLSEADLRQILGNYVAEQVGVDLSSERAKVRLSITNRNHGSLRSTEYQAEVEVAVDLSDWVQPEAKG